MENEEREMVERLEAATAQIEKTLEWLEERQGQLSGEVERITATVEQSRRETELAEKLAAVEQELAELKASAAQNALNPAAQDSAGDHSRDAGQARNRRWPGGRARPGRGANRAEPGAAHRREDATAAGRSDRVGTVVSCQWSVIADCCS